MKPVSPVIPGQELAEIEIKSREENVGGLPALIVEGAVVSRWELTDEDRKAIANGADLFLYVWKGRNASMPPVAIEAATKEEMTDRVDQANREKATRYLNTRRN